MRTIPYRSTVVAKLRRDPEFTQALWGEVLLALTDGDDPLAKSILRDLVIAHLGYRTLSKETGLPEKSLCRMLSDKGNPTMSNLCAILRVLRRKILQ